MAIVVWIRYGRRKESDFFDGHLPETPDVPGTGNRHHLHGTAPLLKPMLFLSRAPRIATELVISILLRSESNGEIVAEPVSGRLCNISEAGACIEVLSPLVSGHHLFYLTLNTEAFSLVLTGDIATEPVSTFSVAASSVWMNATDEEQDPGFRIGVRFRENQRWLFKYFKRL